MKKLLILSFAVVSIVMTACNGTSDTAKTVPTYFHPGIKQVLVDSFPVYTEIKKQYISCDGRKMSYKSPVQTGWQECRHEFIAQGDTVPTDSVKAFIKKEAETTSENNWNIPWHWLGWLLLAGLLLALFPIIWGLLRRLANWANSPIVTAPAIISSSGTPVVTTGTNCVARNSCAGVGNCSSCIAPRSNIKTRKITIEEVYDTSSVTRPPFDPSLHKMD